MFDKLREYIRKQNERERMVEDYLTNKMLQRARKSKDGTNKYF